MKLSQTPLLLGGLVLATLLIACGGGAAEETGTLEATPTSEGDAAAAMAELTVEDLAALVLQQSDYGLMAFGMEISDESGPSDNEKAARDFETLEVTEGELDQLGRLGGYILSFEDLAFAEGQLLQVGSWVELFDASGDLDAYLDLNIQDIRATKDVDGLKVIELNEVDIPEVEGATAWHAVMELPGSEVPFNWSFGVVQRGRLLAGAQVVEFGVTDRTGEMAGVLYQLVTRLDGALAGTLEVSVDHVLPVTADDRRVPAPTGGPDLAAMVLLADDLGPGWEVDEDGYYADPNRLALFQRTFKYRGASTAVVGTSEVNLVGSELQLWPSVEQATAFVGSRRTLFEGAEGAANFARLTAEGGGPTVTHPVTSLETLPLGDQALTLTITADWASLGSQSTIFIWIRRGDLVSQTTIQGTTTPAPAELLALAELAAARLAGGES